MGASVIMVLQPTEDIVHIEQYTEFDRKRIVSLQEKRFPREFGILQRGLAQCDILKMVANFMTQKHIAHT